MYLSIIVKKNVLYIAKVMAVKMFQKRSKLKREGNKGPLENLKNLIKEPLVLCILLNTEHQGKELLVST